VLEPACGEARFGLSRPSRGGAHTLTHGSRSAALVLLGLALMLGTGLRFYRLGAADLSADEAAAWAGAAAPDLHAVAARQPALDAGKLALYDLVLHEWIGLFGDGVFAMRALSALLGIVVMALAFAAAREVMLVLGGAQEIERAALGGALAALLVAVNLVLVTQARTARMYPLMLAMELAQVVCFVRAQAARLRAADRAASLFGVALFSALAVAANFTAMLLIVSEAAWLGWAVLRQRVGRRHGESSPLHLLGPALALGAGLVLLVPFSIAAGHVALGALRSGALAWARMRPPWWPFQLLRRASGKAPFLLFAPLALYAAWRMGRGGGRAALGFLLCWLLMPPVLVMGVSYAITPVEETRYVIASVAAFFILAAAGLAAIEDARLRAALIALALVLSLDHVRRDLSKPQFAEWRAAAALALGEAGPDGRVGVAPAYATNVVRYYLPPAQRGRADGADKVCGMRQRVLILGGMDILAPARLAELENCYPFVVQRLRFVEVRRR
jgi:mannosyltransferase